MPSSRQMQLHEAASLQTLLDALSSPLSSPDERMYALVQLEHFVARRMLEELPQMQRLTNKQTFHAELERCCDWSFVSDGVRVYCAQPFALAESIAAHVATLHILLKNAPLGDGAADMSTPATRHLETLASEMGCALSLLQGMCLTQFSSKALCSSRSKLDLLLCIVDAPYTKSDPAPLPVRLLVSHALDTLMCILVDADGPVRDLFEHVQGPAIVRRVRSAHQGPAASVTGTKCLEFLLFYLHPRAFEQQAAAQMPDLEAARLLRTPPPPPSSPRRAARTPAPPSPSKSVLRGPLRRDSIADANPFLRPPPRSYTSDDTPAAPLSPRQAARGAASPDTRRTSDADEDVSHRSPVRLRAAETRGALFAHTSHRRSASPGKLTEREYKQREDEARLRECEELARDPQRRGRDYQGIGLNSASPTRRAARDPPGTPANRW
ncbi:hypothetical protein MSPP1_000953 [Malassezia sp. CBS 17886]|nr:hypothetical protein MSPP1_000953 [Malassezia sp. CBS 17886]